MINALISFYLTSPDSSMPPILPQNVQIAMSLWDTTTDEISHVRESQACK
jgi:hypothetical protein